MRESGQKGGVKKLDDELLRPAAVTHRRLQVRATTSREGLFAGSP